MGKKPFPINQSNIRLLTRRITRLTQTQAPGYSRRNELPMGGLRRMKMPQEKNGENTDLKCDLVLCRNKDYEKGGHHKIRNLRNDDMA